MIPDANLAVFAMCSASSWAASDNSPRFSAFRSAFGALAKASWLSGLIRLSPKKSLVSVACDS